MKIINYKHIFLNALRTAILFFAGFLLYETLIEFEKIWNVKDPENEALHFYQKKTFKFIGIFILDVILLSILFLLTGEYF
jgi:hypothetical protein